MFESLSTASPYIHAQSCLSPNPNENESLGPDPPPSKPACPPLLTLFAPPERPPLRNLLRKYSYSSSGGAASSLSYNCFSTNPVAGPLKATVVLGGKPYTLVGPHAPACFCPGTGGSHAPATQCCIRPLLVLPRHRILVVLCQARSCRCSTLQNRAALVPF